MSSFKFFNFRSADAGTGFRCLSMSSSEDLVFWSFELVEAIGKLWEIYSLPRATHPPSKPSGGSPLKWLASLGVLGLLGSGF
jgi:hypothetical protein